MVGTKRDRLQMIHDFFNKSASRVNIVAPKPASNRSDLAICAIMRNEERHIGDWLRFHAAAGVKYFTFTIICPLTGR